MAYEKKFTKNGWAFREIKRDGDIVLMKKSKMGSMGDGITSFEVAELTTAANDYTFPGGGTTIKKGSKHYPGNSAWGLTAFTYPDREQADNKFREMVQWQEEKTENKSKKKKLQKA